VALIQQGAESVL